jgi:hypothetical protein
MAMELLESMLIINGIGYRSRGVVMFLSECGSGRQPRVIGLLLILKLGFKYGPF